MTKPAMKNPNPPPTKKGPPKKRGRKVPSKQATSKQLNDRQWR
jgi:hypothetical protein